MTPDACAAELAAGESDECYCGGRHWRIALRVQAADAAEGAYHDAAKANEYDAAAVLDGYR